MNSLKEILKIGGVVFAAYVVFMFTGPEAKADHIKVPSQEEFNWQLDMAIAESEECQILLFRAKSVRTGGHFELKGRDLAIGKLRENPDRFDVLASVGSFSEENIQECAVERTAKYVDTLNNWGEHYPEQLEALSANWKANQRNWIRQGSDE